LADLTTADLFLADYWPITLFADCPPFFINKGFLDYDAS
jgi:hypothetical protein